MAFQPVGQVGFAAGFAEMAGGQRLMRGSVAQQSVLPVLRLVSSHPLKMCTFANLRLFLNMGIRNKFCLTSP